MGFWKNFFLIASLTASPHNLLETQENVYT